MREDHAMKLSRRELLKMGCVSVGALVSIDLFGCSSQPSASSANEAPKGAEANTGTAPENVAASEAANTTATSNPAVVYFSCTGNTAAVAEKVAAATDGKLMRIEAADPYTSADLNYSTDCRANAEQNSGSARPALTSPIPDVAPYDTIYLGYPIWWGKAPRIILTFLEGADVAGKTIIPFCTSGSSPITGSTTEIEQAAPGATVLTGERFSSDTSQQEIDAWVSSL